MSALFLAGPEDSARWAGKFARLFALQVAREEQPESRMMLSRAFVIALEGSLGAGKSHMSRAMLRAWGVDGVIPSPTYSLLEEYPDAHPPAAHMDWYRLGDALELEMLDWEGLNARCGVILVEWASRIPALKEEIDVVLSLTVQASAAVPVEGDAPGFGRALDWRGLSRRGNDLLTKIQPDLEDHYAG